MPLHRSDENNLRGDGSKAQDAGTLRDYIKRMREIAQKFDLRIIDFWDDEKLNPCLETGREFFFDGLHPNDRGHNILAEKIAMACEKF